MIDRANASGVPIDARASVPTAAGLLAAIAANVPQRQAVVPIAAALVPAGDLFGHAAARPATRKRTTATASGVNSTVPHARDWGPVAELDYETPSADEQGKATEPEATHAGVYEPWCPRTARIPGACEHPTPLVQSAAMAAVPHPESRTLPPSSFHLFARSTARSRWFWSRVALRAHSSSTL